MNKINSNINNGFSTIINNYFTKADIKKYKTLLEHELNMKISLKSFEFDETIKEEKLIFYRRCQIEILITFAKLKLDAIPFLDLLLSLSNFSIELGDYSIALELLNKLLAENNKDTVTEDFNSQAYLRIGEIKARQAFWKEALQYLNKAKKSYTIQRDDPGLALCENIIGTVYGDMGQLKKARNHFESGLSLVNSDVNKYLVAQLEVNLAILNIATGVFDIAFTNLYRALKNFEQISDLKRISQVRYNLGFLFLKKGQLELALTEIDLSIEAALNSEHLSELGLVYLCKANIYRAKGEYGVALALADHVLNLSYRINDKLTIADVFKVKGMIYRIQGENALAESNLLTSLRLNKEIDNQYNFAETSLELAGLYQGNNQPEKAKYYQDDAQKYLKKMSVLDNSTITAN